MRPEPPLVCIASCRSHGLERPASCRHGGAPRPRTPARLALVLVLCLVGIFVPERSASAQGLPERTDAELARDARALCEAARREQKLVLLEFAATWCSDCRTLDRLARQAPLADKLREFARLRVNVGRFDRHAALRRAFDVRAIAQWNVLVPTEGSCGAPLAEWPRLAARTLEPQSGAAIRTDELAGWLGAQQARASERTPPAD